MAAGRLERARGVLAALEAAVALEEEDGDVPAPVLVEHLVDTRRKQKLLLTQLRVLRRLLGLIQNPGPPPDPPDLGRAGAQARSRWRGLKSGYGGALGALGGALSPALPPLRRGRGLGTRLGGALEARLRQLRELREKLREAEGRRDQLQQDLARARSERSRRGGTLGQRRGAAGRAEAGCRLYQWLTGVRVLPPPPGAPHVELELGPPPGPPADLPPLRLRRHPGGGFSLVDPAPPPAPHPGAGAARAASATLGGGAPVGRAGAAAAQVATPKFALDWEPALGQLRVLGGPRGSPPTLWTLELEPGYPQRGGVRLLPPPGVEPPEAPPSARPTLTEWLELLVGPPPAAPH